MNTSPTQYHLRISSTQPVVGVLLVHGLNGNTGDMAELAELFLKEGMITKSASAWSW